MKRFCLMAMLTVVVLFAGAAQAAIVGNWIVGPDATYLPGLTTPAGYVMNGLVVTTAVDWTNARLDVHLYSGSIFSVTAGFPPAPQPGLSAANDTGFYGKSYSVPSTAGVYTETATDIGISWFNTATTDTGTFAICNLMLSNDAEGTISGFVLNAQTAEDGAYFDGTHNGQNTLVSGRPWGAGYIPIHYGVVGLPEPASLSLLGVAGLTLLARRQKS